MGAAGLVLARLQGRLLLGAPSSCPRKCVCAPQPRPPPLGPAPRVARFYGQPKAERKATYARWWGVVKKEAKHYWVGGRVIVGIGAGGHCGKAAGLQAHAPGACS